MARRQQAIDELICCFWPALAAGRRVHCFGPVHGAASLCSQWAPTQGFRCGRPAWVSGVGGQLGFQLWAPSPLIWVPATGLQVSAVAAYPAFTVQGLRGEGHQRLRLLWRVLLLAAECFYFLFLFEKFFLFKPPWSKHVPGCSHSSAWLSPKNPAADPASGPGLQPPWSPCWSQGSYCP